MLIKMNSEKKKENTTETAIEDSVLNNIKLWFRYNSSKKYIKVFNMNNEILSYKYSYRKQADVLGNFTVHFI